MKKGLLLLCSVILLGIMPVNAQKVWSLEECISYALENNLFLKRQELNVQYNRNNHRQSYFNTLPNLNGQFGHGYRVGRDYNYTTSRYEDNDYWSGNIGISSSVVLFNGFQILNDIKQKKYLFLQSESDLKRSQNDISLELANGYLQVLFSKELLQVAKSKLDVTSLQAERTKKLLEVGNVAQGEFLQIKAQEANDKTGLVNAQNNLDIALLNLTQLLDLDSSGGFDIVVPENIEVELTEPLETVESIYRLAEAQMPQIKSSEYALKSAEKQLSMAWGQISPSISMSGNISGSHSQLLIDPEDPTGTYPINQQWNDYLNRYVGLSISVPIFNRLQIKNSIDNSRLQVKDYQYRLNQAKMDLYKEVQLAHADAIAAREKYYSSVEAVNYNQEAFKYTSQKMEVGLVNSVDYNIAQNNLISAQSSMLQAKYEYIFRLKILDLYMGKQITL